MTRRLYDLTAADGTRFSPYCWRTKLALAHKNLDYKTIPWHFTDKEVIAFSGQEMVPVLVDGDAVVSDSHAIATYLENTYPHEASLFGDSQAKALILFIKNWTERVLHPAITPLVLPDIYLRIVPTDQPYFRQTREARLNRTIEELAARRHEALPAFQAALAPLKATLKVQPFISGDAPAYADHIVFGALQWARLMSSTALLETDSLFTQWMDSVLAAYDLN